MDQWLTTYAWTRAAPGCTTGSSSADGMQTACCWDRLLKPTYSGRKYRRTAGRSSSGINQQSPLGHACGEPGADPSVTATVLLTTLAAFGILLAAGLE